MGYCDDYKPIEVSREITPPEAWHILNVLGQRHGGGFLSKIFTLKDAERIVFALKLFRLGVFSEER